MSARFARWTPQWTQSWVTTAAVLVSAGLWSGCAATGAQQETAAASVEVDSNSIGGVVVNGAKPEAGV